MQTITWSSNLQVAVTEKTAACEALLEEIAAGTKQASEKKLVAQAKGKEIEEQSVIIAKEKVSWFFLFATCILYYFFKIQYAMTIV